MCAMIVNTKEREKVNCDKVCGLCFFLGACLGVIFGPVLYLAISIIIITAETRFM